MVAPLGLNTGNLRPQSLQIRRWLEALKKGPVGSEFMPPDQLLSHGQVGTFMLGSGKDIIEESCDLILKEAEHEVIFVTCFWAKSDSLTTLSRTLKDLSDKALSSSNGSKIRVRICLSSVSLLQKLFHTTSTNGYVYEPSLWSKKLRLPPPKALPGLDLQIKSIFVLPFSVMHPKFIVIDRRICLLPSCNVSWENWFEGCITLQGPVVDRFVRFWQSFWGQGQAEFKLLDAIDFETTQCTIVLGACNANDRDADNDGVNLPLVRELPSESTEMVFLPSQHHRYPSFRPFPWQAAPEAPRTPLNTYIIRVIDEAQKSIFIQTPNLTSPPVITSLLQALERGVNVTIITSARLMLLEQLITAGTTTSRCLRTIIKAHKGMRISIGTFNSEDLESATMGTGSLVVQHFETSPTKRDTDPVQSHLKLTIVDESIVVLGSGNMDRASFYTSQELGLAILSTNVAMTVRKAVDAALLGRKKTVYRGSA